MKKLKNVLFAAASTLFIASQSLAETRPNIVFILADDQPYNYLGVTGNPVAKTPNIDKLANEGTLFTNTHVTSAICTPSRISILLSQYERKHGVNFNSGTSVAEEAWEQSYPVLFRKAGYYTGWVGKNHSPIGSKGYQTGLMEKSFDYWYASHGHMRFYPKESHKLFSEATADTQLEIISESVDDFFSTNEYRFKKAITFLEKRPADKPFMLSINLNLPHSSSTRAMEQRPTDDAIYRTLYRDKKIPLPDFYTAKADIKKPKLPPELLHTEDRQSGYDYVDTPETVTEILTRQYQAMAGIDRLVGKMLDKLESLNLADNTIIVYSSDHGLFMGEHGLGGKALCYEKVTKVPLIIYDPRQPHKQHRNDSLVSTIDIAPTMLAMADIKQPDSMQGEDLTPVLKHQKDPQRQYSFSENLWSTHFGNPQCESIQNNDWKYIRYYKNNNLSASDLVNLADNLNIKTNNLLFQNHDYHAALYRHLAERSLKGEPAVYEELYHLSQDPEELNNLANNETYSKKLDELRKAWRPQLEMARGEGFPKVSRYTSDMGAWVKPK